MEVIEGSVAYKKYQPDLDFRLKLEVDYKDSDKGIIIADEYGDKSKGLDMDFHIVKTYEPTPKESKIKIYNLTIPTYNLIYEKADAFRLSCARGKDAEYVPFYIGYPIRTVRQSKQTLLTSNQGFMAQDANAGRRGQSDLETEISLMNFGIARLYKSYRADVSTETILNDCINAYGLPKGNMDKINHIRLAKGTTIKGDVSKTLNWLGDLLGFYWNINDMTFNLYDKSCKDIKTYGILLNPDNSATPVRQDDKFKKETAERQGSKSTVVKRVGQGFMIETMLLPFLQVGSTCRLEFDMADAVGDKYIYKIVHQGNNYGTESTTQVYCV